MSIYYKKGDVLQESNTKRVIAHIVNDKGGFGKGFALQVAKKYPIVRKKYKEWYQSSILNDNHNFKLGNVQMVEVDNNLTFVNLLCQQGYASKSNPCPINYTALGHCLEKLSIVENKNVGRLDYNSIPIWLPKIGSGLAGGKWKQIEPIIEAFLYNREVVIFEYDNGTR